jgi:phospho-N-acetylmuramoyl-pentapeptide-transferase
MILDIVKVITPATIAFFIGIMITPVLTFYLYKYKAWKKSPHKIALDGTIAEEHLKLHRDVETKTPRMGGVVIWLSTAITAGGIWLLAVLIPGESSDKLDFVSRNQTWIPLFVLVLGGLVGLINDIQDIREGGERGIPLRVRLLIVSALALFVGWWFYDKLDIVALAIPFNGDLYLGFLIIPFFVILSLCLYASGVIDGVDGLSGGVFASIFVAYSGIAFYQQQIDLAAFCATVAGGLLAFLWFNIPPARFWMTETGTMGLTLTIAVVAFMTDTLGEGEGVLVLPVIGGLLVATVLSNVLQVLWKKYFGRKLFKIAPLHHHFQAIGWPGYKVTMRYWVLSVIFAFIGVIVALVG